MKPIAIDLFCGLGGWTDGLLAEGYRVTGYDIERHEYGEHRYPAELVLQDVLTLDGAQFRDAALIVASPPCQEYSYMAMPWSRAKAKAAAIQADTTGAEIERLNRLFNACFRIQREACAAAGRHIPLVVENVRGAQLWVGPARWSFGSFYLWGDVPALMPVPQKARKVPGFRFDGSGGSFQSASVAGTKNAGGSWSNIGSPGQTETGRNPVHTLSAEGVKQGGISRQRTNGKGDRWFQDGAATHGSKLPARKMASAMIAKIPLPLSRHIAATYLPVALTALMLALPAHASMIVGDGLSDAGTSGPDLILGNGTSGEFLVGGDGNDNLQGAIPLAILANPDAAWSPINLYGGVVLPSAEGRTNVDPRTVAGQPHAIGGLTADGNDTLQGGWGYRAKGGTGADLYINHGFGGPILRDCPPFVPEPIITHACPFETLFDAPREGDRFVFNVGAPDADHPNGFKVDNIVYERITKNNRPYLRVTSFTIEATGPLHRTQAIGFLDDKRGPASAHFVDVPNTGTDTRPNLIRAMIYAAATPGQQPADLPGVPQWLFPIR